MRNLKLKLILLLFCFVSLIHSQNKEFYLEIPNPTNIPTIVINNGKMELVFSNPVLTNLFKNYSIDGFKLAFPGATTPILTIVYIIKCDSKLIDEIGTNFSSYFGNHEEILPIQELYIPNDLGGIAGNPPLDQSYLNFIGAVEAWDISKGNNSIIGIAETVNVTQEDLFGKSVNVDGNSSTSLAHGTWVAIAAAGNTDNGLGIASIGFNATIKSGNSWPALIPIADAGARVINCSWGACSNAPLQNQYGQAIIDELWLRGVIVVVAAGNGVGSCPSSPNLYHYPASLNKVFSVTSVGHRSPSNSTNDGNRRDVFENYNLLIQGPSFNPYIAANLPTMTYNDRVDLSAPGYDILVPRTNGYSGIFGTSLAAPLVTGTIGLMLSNEANPCLYPDEIESILKLTAVKNDLLPLNLPYTGQLGAGRLDAFEAVDMAKDMSLPTGIVEVHDRIIDRWDFVLKTAPYQINMTNNIVTNNATINFTARNNINVISGDYKPAIGLTGSVDLKVQTINNNCNTPPIISPRYSNSSTSNQIGNSKLYPNPNDGDFKVLLNNPLGENVAIAIFDVLGKLAFETSTYESIVDISLDDIPSGIYFVKLTSMSMSETIKFIKN